MAAAQAFIDRQEDEIQVLMAIFMEDFKDMRENDTWKIPRPPEIRLLLKPQHSMGGVHEVYAQVFLSAKMTPRYPDELPTLILENAKGLSIDNQKKLQKEIDSLSKTLRGKEMMLEIAQHIQRFLHSFNKPPKSFYEQMLSNQQKQREEIEKEEEKKQEIRRRKVEKERQHLEDELQRRHEVMKLEIRKRKDTQNEHRTSQPSSLDSSSPNTASSPPFETDGHITKREKNRRSSESRNRASIERQPSCRDHAHLPTTIHFTSKGQRTVHRGRCLGHNDNGSTVYAGMDARTGELVAITEWTFTFDRGRKKTEPNDKHLTSADCVKQIGSIEQELNALLKLRHANLLLYLAMQLSQESNGNVSVMVLSEYCGGCSLQSYISQSLPLPIDIVHHYTRQLLQALQFLHKRDVVHKDFRASSIFVDQSGCLRLADYSINKRLSDLQREVASQQTRVHFTDNDSRPGVTSKKADIYQLGCVLLTLSEGKDMDESSPDLPHHLPADFSDFLSKCVEKDESKRWTADQLGGHPFIKQAITRPMHLHHVAAKYPPNEGMKAPNETIEDDIEFLATVDMNGQSRLTNEFTVLTLLGKGGFGDVIKVRNKLDAQFYAIKRIPLNPKSKHFNKKITREAKLLSRLNHENVVRYYNSWIETSTEPHYEDSVSSESAKYSSSHKSPERCKNSLGLHDDLDMLLPKSGMDGVEWSASHDTTADQSDDSDSDDDAGVFCASFMPDSDSDSDGIIFHQTFNTDPSPSSSDKSGVKLSMHGEESVEDKDVSVPRLQYLYIQMEYCEMSTLRDCIMSGLHEHVDRVWRLFREIIEGLHHIHDKGMIHRDLKPVNMFLDSNDHIKIGDFGLATTDGITRGQLVESSSLNVSIDINMSSRSGSVGDGVLTGKVGTALYVSPEMMTTEGKTSYSQKVDIYSLGIIFFEMCYPPLGTGMERIKVLNSIRQPDVVFPDDFDTQKLYNQTLIIQWLLSHDPDSRPTSSELLQSDYLPPPQRQESELHEMIRSTVSNPQSKSYRHLVNTMFSQSSTALNDLTYDMDLGKGPKEMVQVQQHVHESLVDIFQCHGAVSLTTPLLMPHSGLYEHNDQYVSLMDHSGRIVALPYDLRVPFARYVARNGTTNLKRYCIARVYREKKLFSLHPKEILECAYDVITPASSGLFPDAEIIQIIQEIINKFPPLQDKGYYVRINHVSLLRATLLHCGIPEDQHQVTLEKLAETQQKKVKKADVSKMMLEMTGSEKLAAVLMSIMDTEGPLSKVSSFMRCITKTKGQAASLAKQGLHEIESVMTFTGHMGIRMHITVTLGLIYAVKQYSGIIFQVMSDQRRKKRVVVDVLAAGGRYDKLISDYSSPLLQSRGVTSANQHAAGFSLAFDKICAALLESDKPPVAKPTDVLVSNIGHSAMWRDKLRVASELWGAGIRAEVKADGDVVLANIVEHIQTTHIPHAVVLKDGDPIIVASIEKDKVTEKKVNSSELVEFLSNKLCTSKIEPVEPPQNNPRKQPSNTICPDNTSSVSLKITFIAENDNIKLAANAKRKIETNIYAKLACLSWVSPKCEVEVMAVDLPPNILKSVASLLDVSGSVNSFNASIPHIMETHPPYRKYLSRIFDIIDDLKFNNKCPVLVLYGYNNKQDTFKLLL